MTTIIDTSEIHTSFQALRDLVVRHGRSTAILAALGAAMDAQVNGVPLEPALQARTNEVLGALGSGDMMEGMEPADLKPLLAELRFNMLLDAKLLYHDTRSLAWNHAEPELLEAGGDLSAGFAGPLTHTIVPRLTGLAQALAAPGASFLDIGVGVAGLSVALANRWPALRVVGIDPWAPSLALARKNLRQAGLAERIELREQAAEALSDTNAFDLAWLPSPFMPRQAIPAACDAVYRALRPGGWLLFAMTNPGTDPLVAALVRLRTVLWGGSVPAPNAVERLLSAAGFVDIQTLPSPPDAIVALVAARRMPDPSQAPRHGPPAWWSMGRQL